MRPIIAALVGFLVAVVVANAGRADSHAKFQHPNPAGAIELSADGKAECVQGCKDTHRDQVKLCNTLYPPKHRIEDHRKCLDKARTTFDACMATCR